jgi:hypothetical protein
VNGNAGIGGLVGSASSSSPYHSLSIVNSYASGDVSGSSNVGGLVGSASSSSVGSSLNIFNSYASGDVCGNDKVGGLVASALSSSSSTTILSIRNSYAVGAVSGSSNVGGLVGYESYSTVSESFWDIETSGQTTSAGGTGKNTIQMHNINTYLNAGWNFDGDWYIGDNFNLGYPILVNQIIINNSITNNSTNISLTPTISFELNSIYQYYELYFGTTPNPEVALINFSSVSNPITYTFTETLEPFTNYYWSVVLYNTNNDITRITFHFKTKPEMDGYGTYNDPFIVDSFSDLFLISVNTSLWNKHFIQIDDIDASATSELNSGAGFSPIGSENINFTGSYNGQGFNISNLYINRPGVNNIGLFGYTRRAQISNLCISYSDIIGLSNIGTLAGYTKFGTNISNCYVTGTVNGTSNVGGLVGYGDNLNISNSYSTGVVIGNSNVGGLVGYLYNSSNICNSYAADTVNGTSCVGGLVGYGNAFKISNSYSTGVVSGDSRIGGLVGVGHSYSGSNSSTITNSYSTGPVDGIEIVGGLVGLAPYLTISNSYATGYVNGNEKIGGLVGFMGDDYYHATIINSYATGTVIGNIDVGGLVGQSMPDTSNIINSFWDMGTTGQNFSSGGIGKTTHDMKTVTTFLSACWDFSSLWYIDPNINSGYPFFRDNSNLIIDNQLPNFSNHISVTPTISFKITQGYSNFELHLITDTNQETILIPNSTIPETITYSITNPLNYYSYNHWRVILYSSNGETTNIYFTFKTKPDMGGDGSEETPYLVDSLSDLNIISLDISFWDKHFLQIADIDASASSELNDGEGFSPIGDYYEMSDNNPFTGSYDGQGYSILNLFIQSPISDNSPWLNREKRKGLFGSTDNAIISNLNILKAKIIDKEGYYFYGPGILIGTANRTYINNCHVSGSINIIGFMEETGGLIGSCRSSTISNCSSDIDITGDVMMSGGLIGDCNNTTVTNCFASGKINNGFDTGGLMGYCNNSTVSNCGSSVNIPEGGGLIGIMGNSSLIYSYARGVVSGGAYSGGLVADSWNSTITNSFWDIETSGQTSSAGGTGKTTQEMQTLSTYINAGWDFVQETENGEEDIWTFVATDYPHLSWEGYEQQLSLPPVYLRAQVTQGAINLYWNRPQIETRGLIGYKIFKDDVLINDVILTDDSYNDTDVESGQSYNYYVTAVFDEEESQPSNIIEVLAFDTINQLDGPSNLQISLNQNNVVLIWDASTANLTRDETAEVLYIIHYQDTNGIEDDVFYYLDYTTDLTYTHQNIGEKNRYMFYGVKAYNNVNNILQHRLDKLYSQKGKVTMDEVEYLIMNDEIKPHPKFSTKKK